MSQKSNRPQHDRSKRIKDSENNTIIQLIEKEDGVVSKNTYLIYLKFFGMHNCTQELMRLELFCKNALKYLKTRVLISKNVNYLYTVD